MRILQQRNSARSPTKKVNEATKFLPKHIPPRFSSGRNPSMEADGDSNPLTEGPWEIPPYCTHLDRRKTTSTPLMEFVLYSPLQTPIQEKRGVYKRTITAGSATSPH